MKHIKDGSGLDNLKKGGINRIVGVSGILIYIKWSCFPSTDKQIAKKQNSKDTLLIILFGK